MTISRIAAAPLALALLAGCGGGGQTDADTAEANRTAPSGTETFEDVSPDGLAAPENLSLESESNAAGSASGGNAQ